MKSENNSVSLFILSFCMVVTSVLSALYFQLGFAIAGLLLKHQLRSNSSQRQSLIHLGQRKQVPPCRRLRERQGTRQIPLKKDMVIPKDKATRAEEENTGLMCCLTEGFGDCSEVLEINSYYKADLEHVRDTAVALVFTAHRTPAKIFWQHAFWGKKLSRDSKRKRAEMSKMFKISKTSTVLPANRTFFSCTTLPLGPKQSRSFFFFFLSETEGLSITAKAAKMKQKRHIRHLNTHSVPMLVCCTLPKQPKAS